MNSATPKDITTPQTNTPTSTAKNVAPSIASTTSNSPTSPSPTATKSNQPTSCSKASAPNVTQNNTPTAIDNEGIRGVINTFKDYSTDIVAFALSFLSFTNLMYCVSTLVKVSPPLGFEKSDTYIISLCSSYVIQ